MDETRTDKGIITPEQADDLAKLIRKLRWIGLEEEARRLEIAARSLPPEKRGTVSAEPTCTD